jgi:hypothetical protein
MGDDAKQYMGDGSNVSSNVLSEQLRAQADVIASIGKAMESVKTLRSGVLIASGKTFNGLT